MVSGHRHLFKQGKFPIASGQRFAIRLRSANLSSVRESTWIGTMLVTRLTAFFIVAIFTHGAPLLIINYQLPIVCGPRAQVWVLLVSGLTNILLASFSGIPLACVVIVDHLPQHRPCNPDATTSNFGLNHILCYESSTRLGKRTASMPGIHFRAFKPSLGPGRKLRFMQVVTPETLLSISSTLLCTLTNNLLCANLQGLQLLSSLMMVLLCLEVRLSWVGLSVPAPDGASFT